MDQWKEFFFKFNGNANKLRSDLNAEDRKHLRNSLGCQPFEWYLNKVWPENFFPSYDRFFGRIQLVNMNKADPKYRRYYDLLQDFQKTIYLKEQSVEEKWKRAIKFFNSKQSLISEIFSRDPNDYYCLQKPKSTSASRPHGQSFLLKCSEIYGTINELFVIKTNGHIMTNENLCLDSFTFQSTDTSDEPISIQFAKMATCSTKATQNWIYNINVSISVGFFYHVVNENNCFERIHETKKFPNFSANFP
jgi:polypeptide N-acetylgalactosaminyltransferase